MSCVNAYAPFCSIASLNETVTRTIPMDMCTRVYAPFTRVLALLGLEIQPVYCASPTEILSDP